MRLDANLLALAIYSLLLQVSSAKTQPKNAVLLSSIKALTFQSGLKTTGRRVSAIPQLKCVGGSGRGLYEPDSVRCTNSGSSYSASDIEWTCQASLPPEFKLGSTNVICEGYSSPEDDYILKGSCGLEYRLILTDQGERKFGHGWFKQTDRASGNGEGISATLFWIVFVGVVAWMLYAAFIRDRRGGLRPPRGPGGGFGGGGGGGGGGGWGGGDNGYDDPPPPYSQQKPRTYGSSPRSGAGTYAPRNQGQGWRPGFWTGLGTGAAATHLANRAFGGGRQQGWGGGSGDTGESSSMGSSRRSGGGSSSPSYSSSRYTSTGFGGTSRR